jgi:cell division protein ZipA
MEYFRWILLIAGLLLLAYIYLSGRRKNSDTNYIPGRSEDDDPLFTDQRSERKGVSPEPSFTVSDDADLFTPLENEFNVSDEDLDFFTPLEDLPTERETERAPTRLFASIAEKIEEYSAKLSPKRKERMEASAARANASDGPQGEEKIISLNVMAPEGYHLEGVELHAIFTQRGYEFCDKGLFQSRYKGRTIFSIVNMVEPGSFDPQNMDTLQTPGVTLFLQLPGPISADVLFEVLLSEASDLARATGAIVHDSQRSTLTKQTIQHEREGIYEYMHREKYFSGARPR